ncbi:MAG: glycosyltransferase [Flavobacteriales bacterium]|nr:glycosyltransferase [Flavobacteriales bacterium]
MPLKILEKKDFKMTGKESSPPIISVIIPNYNHAPYLKERIESVLNQSYSNFEVIILDDCSTDNSRDIIESFRGHERIKHIEYNATNSGSTFKQWQKGLNLAKGEWIWIAESDDVAHPEFLGKLTSEITPDCALIFCRSEIINELGKPATYLGCKHFPNNKYFNEIVNLTKEPDPIHFLTVEMYNFNHIVNASSAIFRKKEVPNLDYISTNFKLCGDWMFWIQIMDKAKFKFIDQDLNFFRTHGSSVRSISDKRVFAFFENALITRYIYSKHTNKFLKKKYYDYLIYIYFNRYDKTVRKGTFIRFLKQIYHFGPQAIIESFRQKLKHG